MSIALDRPFALVLLVLIPLYPWLATRSSRAVPLPRSTEMRAAGRRVAVIPLMPGIFRLLVLSALLLAIAGPSSAGAVIEDRTEGIPIVLAIDISSSMLARDFQPQDRLSVAKATIQRFIAGRTGDPIGVVALAGEALTLVPLTTNRPVLQNAIASLEVGLLTDGTAIGDGLAAAVNRLRDVDAGDAVVVLLSDGESNRGTVDPVAAAEAAAALGVRVFTIGVGAEGVASVPVAAAPAGFTYAEQPVGVDEELLRLIAETTGGSYFRATDPAALERIYGEIDELVPSISETTRSVERTGWAGLLLLVGGALLIVEWGMRGSRWGTVP
ncbi:MAG: VWA domain-containing protein [Gemmatimonadota bacterium]